MRDRLIELLRADIKTECDNRESCEGCPYEHDTDGCYNHMATIMADYLIENGVILSPCKVGDTVYRVMADKRIKRPYEYKVIGFWYSADETCNNLHLVRYVNGVFESSMSVPFSEFNRLLFLTKEEAEQALKEREQNDR